MTGKPVPRAPIVWNFLKRKRDQSTLRQRLRQAPRLESLELRSLLTARLGMSPALAEIAKESAIKAAAVSATAIDSPTVNATATTATPTTREVAREHYAGLFHGSYLIGPGRFSDQASTIRIEASGHANQSYNSNMQMILTTPTDTINGQTTGAANIAARNVATSGTALIIDITAGNPTSPAALPTSGTWTISGSSGGAYSSAGQFGDGSGTVSIRYIANGKVPKGARGAGRVVVAITGQINTSGVTNPVFGPANTPRKP